jgi:hypothetical protein
MQATHQLRVVAEAVVPESSDMDEAGWAAFHRIIEHALSQRSLKMQRQLRLFLRILNVLSVARHGRTLSGLSLQERTRFLERIQDSRLLLFRRGFWGVRTLILMGYYARPEARALVGYGANSRGWQAWS